jgi:hypothetical protein
MDFLVYTMRHIPDAGDCGDAKNENYNEEDKQDFDERTARFGRSSGDRWSSGSRRRRPWLRSSLRRGLRARGAGRSGRRWCCGPHRRTGSGRSAPSAESLSIIQRTATISAKTSHFASGACGCGARFFRSCQNRRARASATCCFVVRPSYVGACWACATEGSKSCGGSFSE